MIFIFRIKRYKNEECWFIIIDRELLDDGFVLIGNFVLIF